MNRIRVVTEKTRRGQWVVRIVETNIRTIHIGWRLEAKPYGIFIWPPFFGTDFPSRKAARECLRQYIANCSSGIRITGGLH